MNNIEILEELKARLKLYKKSTDVQFTFTKSDIQAIENLIQENKELKEVLEKVSKDLDNIAYDQIPIEMQRAFGKEYDLGYRQGWYNAEEDWKLKVKEIIYPTPENPISLEIQTSEMYKKILNILEE